MTIAVNMLVIFALLIASGYAPYAALSKARIGTLTEQDLRNLDAAGLPLSDHASGSHAGQKCTAETIQKMLRMGVCSPKVYYTGCSDKRVLLGCKASVNGSLWALLVIGFKDWYHPVIVTGYALERTRLDATATRNGCKLPGLYMP